MEEKHNKTCSKCKENFVYFPDEVKWIDYGTYSVKVCTCPYCGTVQSIKFENASGLNLNNDSKYYTYR